MGIIIPIHRAQEIAKDLKDIKEYLFINHKIAGDLRGLVLFKIDNVVKIFDEEFKRQVKDERVVETK